MYKELDSDVKRILRKINSIETRKDAESVIDEISILLQRSYLPNDNIILLTNLSLELKTRFGLFDKEDKTEFTKHQTKKYSLQTIKEIFTSNMLSSTTYENRSFINIDIHTYAVFEINGRFSLYQFDRKENDECVEDLSGGHEFSHHEMISLMQMFGGRAYVLPIREIFDSWGSYYRQDVENAIEAVNIHLQENPEFIDILLGISSQKLSYKKLTRSKEQ